FVLVPDKGLDRLFGFRFDEKTGQLSPTDQRSVVTRAGSGPRHLAFHPKLPVVWLLHELNNSVATCLWDAATGAVKPIQILPSLPPDFTGDSTAAEIAVSLDGRFVYCSNRGHDSIAADRVNPRTGLLTAAGWTPAGGKIPRFIGFEPGGRFLYSANEQADTIVAFRANPATGRLTAAGSPIANRSPAAIAFTEF
ncbi:MAG: beta-propeller fold lactonase family protein, partial [Acidobacteriota bacterium]